LRLATGKVHTPTMTLKNAALLALVGTILMTALLVWTFVSNAVNILRGVEAPAVTVREELRFGWAPRWAKGLGSQ
jgi:hypothetical protein